MPFGVREARRVSSWEALRRTAAVLLMAGAGVLTPIVLVTATSSPAAAESLTPTVNLGFSPVAVAADSSGDIYMAAPNGNIDVWSATATTLYGTTVPADTVTTLVDEGNQPTDSLTYHDGDLWISSSVNGSGFVQVLSATGGNYFGVSVPADTATIIVNGIGSEQVAFDASGNLFIANAGSETFNGGVYVLPVSSGSLYGQSVTTDTLSQLTTDQAYGIAINSTSGNLYYSTGNTAPQAVWALTDTSGPVFGVSVSADTPTQLFDSVGGLTFPYQGFNPDQMTLDSAGSLYVINAYTSVMVDAATSGTYVGTSVTADQPTQLDMAVDALQATFDSSGDLLLADVNDDAIVTATTPTASMSALYVTGPLSNPTITIDGSGFGSQPSGVPAGCGATGDDYMLSQFVLWDVQQGWQVGYPGDCIGMKVSSWTATQVVVTFGSFYSNYNPISVGDTLLVGLQGDYADFLVGPLVHSVVPDTGPDSGGTTVTINGVGFTGATAVDFGSGNPATYTVNTDNQITATAPEGSTGPVDVTVTTPVGTSPTSSSDQFTYTTNVPTDYSCAVPGDGTVSFPVNITESPAPPATQYVGASFQETLAAQVTIPAPVSEYYIGQGADALTLESQSTTENGLASADGPASGAVDPSSETASATDVPQAFSPLSNAPISYQTTYDPVTWQTGPGTGDVYLTPGDISIVVTYVVDGTPETDTISCTPPAGEGAIDTTDVVTSPTEATVQVPTSTPPVQSQVTAGSDDGWTFTVTNTSQATVKALQTQVTIGDGNPTPPSFDTTAITASGTKGCTVTSPGVLTCGEGDLVAGASDTVNVLVETTDLTDGDAVTGTAAVTSTNAASASDNLGQFSLVTVDNGVDAAVTPGIAVTSSTAPLSQTGGDVNLTLPKTKIPEMGPMARAVTPEAKGGTIKPPVVGMTLESLPSSDQPALCPPADGGCPGNVIEVEGDFSSYVSQAHPVSAVIQIYFGDAVPSGLNMYMLEFSGSVVKLPACVKTSGDYNTPCVKGKQKTIGSSGDLSAQDTVLFTANDPGFTFR
jgi:hypothetical protein